MVFFVCEVCNESLKGKGVEKHWMCCQGRVVSCIDCSLSFHGNGYKQHISCVSEREKYAGKMIGFSAKLNKGEIKQDAWISSIHAAINSKDIPSSIAGHIHLLKDLRNIPSKKKKFINFTLNSLKLRNSQIASNIWDFIQENRPLSNSAPSETVEKLQSESKGDEHFGDTENATTNRDGAASSDGLQTNKNCETDGETVGVVEGTVEEESQLEPSKKKRKKSKTKVREEEILNSVTDGVKCIPVPNVGIHGDSTCTGSLSNGIHEKRAKKRKKIKAIDMEIVDETVADKELHENEASDNVKELPIKKKKKKNKTHKFSN